MLYLSRFLEVSYVFARKNRFYASKQLEDQSDVLGYFTVTSGRDVLKSWQSKGTPPIEHSWKHGRVVTQTDLKNASLWNIIPFTE